MQLTIDQFQQILLWCWIINLGLLCFSVVIILGIRDTITRFHSKLFSLPEEKIRLAIYMFLGNWKLLTFIFFFIPWCVLRFLI